MSFDAHFVYAKFEPRDMWVGVYWNRWRGLDRHWLSVYVCPVPTLVVRVDFRKVAP